MGSTHGVVAGGTSGSYQESIDVVIVIDTLITMGRTHAGDMEHTRALHVSDPQSHSCL